MEERLNETWQVGAVRISRVVELEVTGGTRFILPDATRDACRPIEWLRPHFMDAAGNLVMSVHALVVDTGKRRIVVDTCIGNDKERDIPAWRNLQTSFLADLAAAGYAPETIDTVLCTHLHVDHVGWNTRLVDGEWVPTFPNARYLVAEAEWAYWQRMEAGAPVLADSVRPVMDAGLMDCVATDHRICPEVALEPTPGHTPGHVSVYIRSAGREAVITGDAIHHPCQMTRPDWCSPADFDQRAALNTRESLLRHWADAAPLVIGTHFATPTAGYVKRRDAGGYWLDTELGAPRTH